MYFAAHWIDIVIMKNQILIDCVHHHINFHSRKMSTYNDKQKNRGCPALNP